MRDCKASIAIMGAGAIGSAIGGMLAAHGHRVTFVGRKPHMDAILKKGLLIKGIWGRHEIHNINAMTTPPDNYHDIVFLTVKSFDTRKAALEALGMVRPETIIVSIQNGLGNIETLVEIAGKTRTIGGTAIFGAVITEPGTVEVTVIASETLIGELDGSTTSRVEAITGILDSSGIPAKTSDNIMRDIWHKVLYNIALNPLSAIFEVPYGVIADNPDTRLISELMICEAFAVARAEGVNMGVEHNEYLEMLWNLKLPPTRNHISSMLQDIIRGKRTEIDYINGAIVRLGKEHKIETPYNSAIVSMVRAKEAINKHRLRQ